MTSSTTSNNNNTSNDHSTSTTTNNEEYDLYKHSIVRYLGYTNEVGEAFRSFLPKSIVNFTYIVASGYALADAVDKGYKQYKLQSNNNITSNIDNNNIDNINNINNIDTNNLTKSSTTINYKPIIHHTSDTLIWQFFASVTIPAFFVNRTCSIVKYSMNRMNLSEGFKRSIYFKSIPTLSGLAIIPFLPLLLDHPIDLILDKTTRPLLNKYLKD
ncbi:predicted protein [Naegleria gruberi]|uniref:Mitochondrial fission process protein 1 n=1 Tax=Naegleria gruberi TaxID=5762 RepID=D2VRJ6_NAEGR|nr:uncharacterized protein NAEGRDRAFT_71608 [Naegleria gruberi]EFC40614.1 predicted protein [Naegleria gruberi]|eukprot:XP_002673358.1 predicted protein [Naegleria gruberi strain NEG-M]